VIILFISLQTNFISKVDESGGGMYVVSILTRNISKLNFNDLFLYIGGTVVTI